MEIYTDYDGRVVSAIHSRSAAHPEGDNANLFTVRHGEGQTGLPFQNGHPLQHGVNGLTTECLLAVALHRTRVLNEQLQCPENEQAIVSMQQALQALELRAAKRRVNQLCEADRV